MLFVRTIDDIFKDINVNFTAHPENGSVSVVKNENAIKQQIKNLVLTNKYESLFKPNVYGGVYDALFDNFDPITVQMIRTSIRDVINNFCDRAELVSITLEDKLDLNGIDVSITFLPLSSATPTTLDFFLSRIR